jgi:hypothetical protein
MVTPMMPEKQSAVSCGSMDSARVKTVETEGLIDIHKKVDDEDDEKYQEVKFTFKEGYTSYHLFTR